MDMHILDVVHHTCVLIGQEFGGCAGIRLTVKPKKLQRQLNFLPRCDPNFTDASGLKCSPETSINHPKALGKPAKMALQQGLNP
jgi:hypothetical protein